MPAEKATFRRQMQTRRAALSEKERAAYAHKACQHLLNDDVFTKAGTVVALYAAYKTEADPSFLEAHLVQRGLITCYPRVVQDDLVFRLATHAELVPSPPWSILEPTLDRPAPKRIDVLIVPGLGFTSAGHRMGYGRGFYDRCLARLRTESSVTAIGFGFNAQLVPEVPTEPHDERLDAVVTEEGWARS